MAIVDDLKSVNRNETKRWWEDRLDSLSQWLEKWTALVVIGLLTEIASEAVREFTGSTVRFSNLVGEILIVIGVAGELWVEVRSRAVSDTLRELTDSIIAELNAEIERLRKENNDLSRHLSDRTIDDIPAFIQALKGFAGTEVMIGSTDDPESRNLLWMLTNSLRGAEWLVTGPVVRYQLRDGVEISLAKTGWDFDSRARRAAIALGNWLDKGGTAVWQSTHDERWGLEPGALIVNVGAKPRTVELMKLWRERWHEDIERLVW